MKHICSLSGQTFTVSQAEQEFCRKHGIPLPQLCPRERLKEQIVFRNRLFLYNSKCDFSGQKVLSCIPPERKLKIYDIEIWESDRWDPCSYARDYDFSRSFFQQYAELISLIPWPNLAVMRSSMENSDYCNGVNHLRNCYLVFSSHTCEDCYFSKYINRCRSLFECFLCFDSELCYSSRNLANCYNLAFSENCFNCTDSAFMYNCQGCNNCFGCFNMSNKQYHFFNQAYSPEEYQHKLAGIELGSHAELDKLQKHVSQLKPQFPQRYIIGKRNEDSSGNYLNNTRYCYDCFFVSNAEELENCIWVDGAKNCFFYTMWGENAEVLYQVISSGHNVQNLKFCNECWKGAIDLEYCMCTGYSSSNCFGCFGLKKKSYCILNKQYTKDEYFSMLERIKQQMRANGEYGKFFPRELSPFYYNHSDNFEFFPLSKEQALKLGFRWLDEQTPTEKTTYLLPDHINQVGDDILSQQLVCELSGKKYRIIKAELEFYRNNGLPVPRIAPFERLKRMGEIAEIKPLRETNCENCQAELQSMHSSADKIYCESCYQNSLQ